MSTAVSTVVVCPFTSLANDYRMAAGHGRNVATRLAYAFTVSQTWAELYACCRYDRAVGGYSEAISAYLEGAHFVDFKVFGESESDTDFDTLKAMAWEFRAV